MSARRAIDWGELSFFLDLLAILIVQGKYIRKLFRRPSTIQLVLFLFSAIWLLITRLVSSFPVFSNWYIMMPFQALCLVFVLVLPTNIVTYYLEKKVSRRNTLNWHYLRKMPAASVL